MLSMLLRLDIWHTVLIVLSHWFYVLAGSGV